MIPWISLSDGLEQPELLQGSDGSGFQDISGKAARNGKNCFHLKAFVRPLKQAAPPWSWEQSL